MLEIIEAASPAAAFPGRTDPGLRHLALAVSNFEEEYRRLQAAGVVFVTAPETVNGNSLAFFTDCDGNLLHLLHREKPLV